MRNIKRCYLDTILNKNRSVLLIFLCLLLLCPKVHSQPSDLIVAWGEGEYQGSNIYFAQKLNQIWSKPMRLSFSANPEVMPTLSSNLEGDIWVIWTVLSKLGGKLQFRQYKNGNWLSTQTIQTSTKSDMAPSAIVDQEGSIWLVWSGTDGEDDDIFSSRWVNGHWSNPLKVNMDDDWPDILPQLDLTSRGDLRVSWSGYDGEKYRNFYSLWDGSKWRSEQISSELVNQLNKSMQKSTEVDMTAIISELPDFVTDIDRATIHFRNQGRANTLRLKQIR